MKNILLGIIFISNILVAKTIIITTGEWKPWLSHDLKKNGVISDIVISILDSQNIKSKFVFYPWKRAYALAKVGKAESTGVWFKTKKREKDFLFSDSIFSTKDILIYKKGKKIIFNNFEDLQKYKFVLVRGFSYGKVIDKMIEDKKLNVTRVNSDIVALNLIAKRNDFDVFICTKSVTNALIENNFKDEDIFDFHSKPTTKNNLYLLVSKKIKNGKEIIDAFNKGLKEFKSKGLIKKMIDNSFQGKYK